MGDRDEKHTNRRLRTTRSVRAAVCGTQRRRAIRRVWNAGGIDTKTRCIVTVVALMSSGITDSSLKCHLENVSEADRDRGHYHACDDVRGAAQGVGRVQPGQRGVGVREADAGTESGGSGSLGSGLEEYASSLMFEVGEPNDAYAQYFRGQSYLAPVVGGALPVNNVTFEPGCRNNWHIHHATTGGGQLLLCVGGRGWYQEWSSPAVLMEPGNAISIPAGVKHWHGAAADSRFSHLAIEIPGTEASNEWLEPVSSAEYEAAGK